jgi:hypothetical protein
MNFLIAQTFPYHIESDSRHLPIRAAEICRSVPNGLSIEQSVTGPPFGLDGLFWKAVLTQISRTSKLLTKQAAEGGFRHPVLDFALNLRSTVSTTPPGRINTDTSSRAPAPTFKLL